MMMNGIIAASVGAVAAAGVLIGGVHMAQGDQHPVSSHVLQSYASR